MLRTRINLTRRVVFRVASEIARAVVPVERLIEGWRGLDVGAAVPILFIVGAPRSGSTHLFQFVTDTLLVEYVSNLSSVFFRSPVIGQRLARVVLGDAGHGTRTSVYGHTPGLRGPAECGQLWYRWFSRGEDYVRAGQLDSRKRIAMRRTFAAIHRDSGWLFVVKNLQLGQKIQALHEVFPEALFVFCFRDPAKTAMSILRARFDYYGTPDAWFSVRPRNYADLLALPPVQQVVDQVYFIERQIHEDLRKLEKKQVLYVNHDDFCRNPRRYVGTIQEFIRRNGWHVERRCRHRTRVEEKVRGPQSMEGIGIQADEVTSAVTRRKDRFIWTKFQ